MKKTAWQMVEEAETEIVTLSPQEALELQEKDAAVLVDIRDIRELGKVGRIPGAVHAPRGMLEFWVDPQSEYYRDVFGQTGKTYILFCAAAGRSALATRDLQNMGFGPVAHVAGGFSRWKDEGLPIDLPDSGGKA